VVGSCVVVVVNSVVDIWNKEVLVADAVVVLAGISVVVVLNTVVVVAAEG
jgi:hypothetical protein